MNVCARSLYQTRDKQPRIDVKCRSCMPLHPTSNIHVNAFDPEAYGVGGGVTTEARIVFPSPLASTLAAMMEVDSGRSTVAAA